MHVIGARARAVSLSTRADPQRGCRACIKTTAPTMHGGSGGAMKQAARSVYCYKNCEDLVIFLILVCVYMRPDCDNFLVQRGSVRNVIRI